MKRLTIDDVSPHPQEGQYWALLSPLRLFRIDALSHASALDGSRSSVTSVSGTTWVPHGVIQEHWFLPLNREEARLLWYVSILHRSHFGGLLPSKGSVWAFKEDGCLLFVGESHEDNVFVYTDWPLTVSDEPVMFWMSLVEVQIGSENSKERSTPTDPTALDQVLAED